MTCDVCPVGEDEVLACSATANIVCHSCAKGRFNAVAGNSCADCIAGQFSAATGLASCAPCSNGEFSGAGRSVCSSCAVGTFMSSAGSSECLSCETGKHQDTTGQTECVSCSSSATYCPGLSTVVPIAASMGFYTTTTTNGLRSGELSCPDGYYCEAGVKFECTGMNAYCPGGTSAAWLVASGYHVVNSSDSAEGHLLVNQTECGVCHGVLLLRPPLSLLSSSQSLLKPPSSPWWDGGTSGAKCGSPRRSAVEGGAPAWRCRDSAREMSEMHKRSRVFATRCAAAARTRSTGVSTLFFIVRWRWCDTARVLNPTQRESPPQRWSP